MNLVVSVEQLNNILRWNKGRLKDLILFNEYIRLDVSTELLGGEVDLWFLAKFVVDFMKDFISHLAYHF